MHVGRIYEAGWDVPPMRHDLVVAVACRPEHESRIELSVMSETYLGEYEWRP